MFFSSSQDFVQVAVRGELRPVLRRSGPPTTVHLLGRRRGERGLAERLGVHAHDVGLSRTLRAHAGLGDGVVARSRVPGVLKVCLRGKIGVRGAQVLVHEVAGVGDHGDRSPRGARLKRLAAVQAGVVRGSVNILAFGSGRCRRAFFAHFAYLLTHQKFCSVRHGVRTPESLTCNHLSRPPCGLCCVRKAASIARAAQPSERLACSHFTVSM